MFELLRLADARIVVALNHWVASSPSLYSLALHVTDKFSDLLTLATFALLWFWPRAKEREYLQAYPDTPPSRFQRLKLWPRRVRYRWTHAISREESRAQFLVLGLTGVFGYVTARLIAFELNVSRPFATILPIRAGVPGAFEGLRTYGSFPSDHAVLLAALPVALFFWDRTLAYIWLGFALIFATARVAVGFHSPLDMAGGALIGVLLTYGGLCLYRRRGAFERFFQTFARGFELRSSPYCYILYVLVALGAVEFAMHFQHVLDALFAARGELLARFGHRG
jgi:membrane-associated phospholipid phosphatase